jgi:transketolase
MVMQDRNDLDLTCINTIRTLSMDAVQAANSGHPGTPMALAPAAYCLWQQYPNLHQTAATHDYGEKERPP